MRATTRGWLGLMRLACVVAWFTSAAHAGEPAKAAWASAPVTLGPGPHDVAAVLKRLTADTGNTLFDRRGPDAPASLTFDGNGPYWQVVDRLAAAAGARLAPHDDGWALTPGAAKVGPVSYADFCRCEIKRIATQHDFETGRRVCVVTLHVAWEPRLEPLYVTVDAFSGTFRETAGRPEVFHEKSRASQAIARRRFQEIELRMPAPLRAAQTMSLQGTLRFVGPAKMLDFRFKNLVTGKLPPAQTQDGVEVSFLRFDASLRSIWAVDVVVQNPRGTPGFESYQSWIDNNRIRLEPIAGTGRAPWLPSPEDEQLLEDLTARRAAIRYRFRSTSNKSGPDEWTLHYRTPGPIAERTVTFSFAEAPLP